MRMQVSIFTLIVAIALVPPGSPQRPNQSAPGVLTVVPIELTQDVTFFRVRVNGSESLWFNLDSGSGSSYLDSHVAAKLGFQPEGKGIVHGAGAGGVPVRYLESTTFQLADLALSGYRVNIADLHPVAEQFGREEDGFLGYDFLSRYVVIVDYQAKTMTVLDPAAFRYDGKGHAFPLTFRHHWPYIHGTIKVAGLAPQSAEYLVDSGSGDAVDDPAILNSTAPLRPVKTGVGLGEPGQGQLGRAEYLQLGPWRLMGPITACCSSNPDDQKKIGSEVLRRFRVIYDYPHQQIILEPNASLADPFPNA